MVSLNWKWAGSETEDGVPSLGEIIVYAMELLEDAWKRKSYIGCGGFVAEYKEGYLFLHFEVASWGTNDE